MIIIKMDNITIDRALRILKSKVNKTKLIKELLNVNIIQCNSKILD